MGNAELDPGGGVGSGHLLEVRLRIKTSPSRFAGSSNTMASCPCCAGAAGSVCT